MKKKKELLGKHNRSNNLVLSQTSMEAYLQEIKKDKEKESSKDAGNDTSVTDKEREQERAEQMEHSGAETNAPSND